MNYKMILFIIGSILKAEAVLLLVPAFVAAMFGEPYLYAFIIPAIAAFPIGTILTVKKPKNMVIYAREGFLSVALVWVIFSLFACMPFMISGAIPNFIDSLFESVSGITTTGATILTNIEAQPISILFWRSFTQWIGGVGVIVFILAIVPLADRSMNLMRAELPGPSIGKLAPKTKDTALILIGIYISLTFLEIFFLFIGGMPIFDCIMTSLSTASTGGFCMKNMSIAAYDSAYIESVLSVFMVIGGISFSVLYLVVIGKIRQALLKEEFLYYIGFLLITIILVSINITSVYDNFGTAFRHASFTVTSLSTSTGYSTVDYNTWPQFSRALLYLLMFVGACAGSTGGGVKMARIIIMFKEANREVIHIIHPRAIKLIKMDKTVLDEDMVRGVNAFIIIFIIIFLVSFVIISFDGFDFETNISSVLACFNNIGPGFSMVGTVGNFSAYSPLSKVILTIVMLIGRLEIFPIILLASPFVWRRH